MGNGRAARRRAERAMKKVQKRPEQVADPAVGVVDLKWDGKRTVGLHDWVLRCGGCRGGLSLVEATQLIAGGDGEDAPALDVDSPATYLYCQRCQGVVSAREAARKIQKAVPRIQALSRKVRPGSHPILQAAAPRGVVSTPTLYGPDGEPLE